MKAWHLLCLVGIAFTSIVDEILNSKDPADCRVETRPSDQMKQQFPFNPPNLTVMEIWAIFKEDLRQIFFSIARIYLKTSKRDLIFMKNSMWGVSSQSKSRNTSFDLIEITDVVWLEVATVRNILLVNTTDCSPPIFPFNVTCLFSKQ